jgi:hypothetical protein
MEWTMNANARKGASSNAGWAFLLATDQFAHPPFSLCFDGISIWLDGLLLWASLDQKASREEGSERPRKHFILCGFPRENVDGWTNGKKGRRVD